MKKKIFIIIALMMAVMAACTEKSPADEVAVLLEKRAAAIDRATTAEEAFKAASGQQAEFNAELTKIIETNPDYCLTEEDRTHLKNAIHNYLEVSYKKSAGFNGEKPENIDANINATMEQMINPIIDNTVSISQLGSAIKL